MNSWLNQGRLRRPDRGLKSKRIEQQTIQKNASHTEFLTLPVLNVLSRLQEQRISEPPVATMLTLSTPPQANLQRYDALRNALPLEASQESDHA